MGNPFLSPTTLLFPYQTPEQHTSLLPKRCGWYPAWQQELPSDAVSAASHPAAPTAQLTAPSHGHPKSPASPR